MRLLAPGVTSRRLERQDLNPRADDSFCCAAGLLLFKPSRRRVFCTADHETKLPCVFRDARIQADSLDKGPAQ
jgi:hypothetical protein